MKGSDLFAGGYMGINRSSDHGNTWTAVDTALAKADIYSFAVAGNDIYAGTYDGVFRSTDNGDSRIPD
jgi:photosystem II stability/assembly factor-like uncharacterized protein